MDEVSNDVTARIDRIRSRLTEMVTTPKGTEISILFNFGDERYGVTPAIKKEATKFFVNAYDYLADLVGVEILGNEFGIQFGRAFLAEGTQIVADVSALETSIKEEADKYLQDLNTSIMIHEIAHQFDDEEGTSMLAEMTYMMENHHPERVEEIEAYLLDGSLPERHIKGLKAITVSLQASSPINLLEDIRDERIDLDTMKKEFKKMAKNSVEEMKEEGL